MSIRKSIFSGRFRQRAGGVMISMLMLVGAPGLAQDTHQHNHAVFTGPAPAPFIASTARSFAQLMDDAMGVMDYGMRAAPMDGKPNHDFVTMMIPHHQGAVDMAKVELLYGKDPALRRLAQEIIVSQDSEIAVMQMSLKQFADTHSNNASGDHHHE
jgi:uncharacterized protein (DUF305 family)